MKQKSVLLTASFFHFIQDGYVYSIFILIPFLSKEFDLSLSQAGLLKTGISGASSLFQIPAVFLAEKAGEAATLIAGFGLLSLGYMVMAGAAAYGSLLLLALIAGLGHSVQHPIATSFVSKAYRRERLGTSIGTLNLAGDIGKVAISLLITVLCAAYGWRTSLGFLGGIGMVIAVAAGLLRKNLFPTEGTGGTSEKESTGSSNPRDRFSSIKSRPFLILSFIGLIDCSVRMAVFTFIPFLAMQKGVPKEYVGFIVNILFFGGIFGKFVCGYLSDRHTGERVIMLSEFVTALLIVSLLAGPVFAFVPLALVLGVFLNGSSSILYSIVPSLFSHEERTMGYAFFYTVYLFSGALGPAFYGLLADLCGLDAAFVFLAISAVFVLPLALLLKRAQSRRIAVG